MVALPEKSGFQTRLTMALEDADVPARKRTGILSKWCRVSRESARKWLAGESTPETKRIEVIAYYLNINGEWLLTGRGAMRGEPTAEVGEPSPPRYAPASAEPHMLIDAGLLMNLLDELDLWSEPPENNRERADILADGYARLMLAMRTDSRERIKSILSQPAQKAPQHHEGKTIAGKGVRETGHE